MNVGLHPIRPVALPCNGLFRALPSLLGLQCNRQARTPVRTPQAASHASGGGGYWASFLFLFILLILGSNLARGWPRFPYSDTDVVQRSDLIIIAHVKEGSIVYVPHTMHDGGMIWEHHATLLVTEVIKGAWHDKELPIIIYYGLGPVVWNGENDPSSPHPFSESGVEKYLGPTSIIYIEDSGGRSGRVSGDIRKDQIWFLRPRTDKSPRFEGDQPADALGIEDPQDIQPLELKPYFRAFLTGHLEEKLKEYAVGASPLAIRSKVHLDHLKMEEILKEPNLTKRTEALLPFFLITDEGKEGPTQSEARFKLQSCGQTGAARLVQIFKDPKYEAMQSEIMLVWSNSDYNDAVPILINFLQTENRYWAHQTLAERRDLRDDVTTTAQVRSRNRMSSALFCLKMLGDPRSKLILEETKEFWKKLFPESDGANMTRECDEALLWIKNAEEDRKRAKQ
jgi:hypothetical protein